MSRSRTFLFAAAALCVGAPVNAGEVTGTGEPTGLWGHAVSECAFSGLNDNDGDPRDPGGFTQNYGTNVSLGIVDPQNLDPNADAPFVPIPGFACNPNRGREGPFFPDD
jgi:hypothetical protein